MHLLQQLHIRMATCRRDAGASLVEYALLVALIAVACLAALVFFQEETQKSFSKSASSIRGAG